MIARLVAATAGLTLLGVSLASNMTYALARSTGFGEQVSFGALAAAAAMLMAVLPSALVKALGERRFGAAALCLAGLTVFGSYSIAAVSAGDKVPH